MTFTDQRGWEIGDNPQDFEPSGDDDDSVVKHLTDEFPGVVPAPEDDAVLPGVDTEFDAEPTGVEVDSDYAPQESAEVNGLGNFSLKVRKVRLQLLTQNEEAPLKKNLIKLYYKRNDCTPSL